MESIALFAQVAHQPWGDKVVQAAAFGLAQVAHDELRLHRLPISHRELVAVQVNARVNVDDGVNVGV